MNCSQNGLEDLNRLMTRRAFFQQSATGAVAIGLAGAGIASGDNSAPRQIIDTHTHFYDPTRPEGVPWPGKDDKLLYRTVLPDDYKKFAKPLGVTGTVVVEASSRLEDNQWVLDLAEKDPFIVGLVGHLTPGTEDFAKHLQRFAKNRFFRGIRIGHALIKQKLADESFVRDLKRLAENDLELDINGGPDMPADVARVAKAVPELRIVINHVANVKIDGKAPPEDWHRGMQAAAANERVFCKVSALVEGTGHTDGKAPAEVDFYKPVLDAVWKLFGADRLIYGSNWPVSERFAPYAVVQKIVSDYFHSHGTEAAEKYFSRNALAAYKWVKRT